MTRFAFRSALVIAAMSALPAVLVTSSFAARGPHPGSGPDSFEMGRLLGHMSERLDLTDTQEEEIRAVLKSRHSAARSDLEHLRDAQEELRAAIHAPDADESAIRESAAQVAAVQSDLAVARAGTLQEVRTVLDEEQVAALQEILDELPERGEGPPDRYRRGPRKR